MFNTKSPKNNSTGPIGQVMARGDLNVVAQGWSWNDNDISNYNTLDKYKSDIEFQEKSGQMLGSLIAEENVNDDRARISGDYLGGEYINQGWVGMRYAEKSTEGYTMPPGLVGKRYLYYAGTATSYPILTFTITINVSGNDYYSIIGNSEVGNQYSSFYIRGKKRNELKITTPGILTAYNQAIKICNSNITDPLTFKDIVINGINHYKVREAVMNGIIKNNQNEEIIDYQTIYSNLQTLLNGKSMTVKINCKTGKTTIKGEFTDNKEEDAGDMILSNYLKIDERNHFSKDGYIDIWENDPECSQIFYHNLGATLTNVNLEYRYMYF